MILQGKTAIVTGATRGIGRAIAIRFAREGANVAFCGRSRNEALLAVEQELNAIYASCPPSQGELSEGLRGKAKGYVCDVADYAQAQAFVKEVLSDFGRVDILVNNAGIKDDAAVKRMTEEQFDRVVGTNLKSVFSMTKAIQPAMWRQGHGSIVNIGSVVAHDGYPLQAAYAASKHALLGMTKALAKEVAPEGIRVHMLSPGGVYTDMVKIARPDLSPEGMIMPEEIAELAAFLIEHRANGVIDEIQIHRAGKEPFA
jgi:3-oxoacyl-[acyl-carrier protein] reductase